MAQPAVDFAAQLERYRAELRVHCYRMLGSLQDAEDLVQETFLRAWAKRDSFEGRSSLRTWLYGIATNASIDVLRRRSRRVLPPEVAAPADPRELPRPHADLPWLEPFPDRLLDELDPGAAALERETIELAFLAAIQQLPPRQRAVLILRDLLDWSAKETAELLETSVPAVNSALQRAHATFAAHLPVERSRWPRAAASATEQALLRRLLDAWDDGDAAALAALLREDARLAMPPTTSWYEGREAVTTFLAEHVFGPTTPGPMRVLATAANRQPALALYLQRPGETGYRAFAIVLLRVDGTEIAELTLFQLPRLFPAFGLPPALGDR